MERTHYFFLILMLFSFPLNLLCHTAQEEEEFPTELPITSSKQELAHLLAHYMDIERRITRLRNELLVSHATMKHNEVLKRTILLYNLIQEIETLEPTLVTTALRIDARDLRDYFQTDKSLIFLKDKLWYLVLRTLDEVVWRRHQVTKLYRDPGYPIHRCGAPTIRFYWDTNLSRYRSTP